MERKKRKPLKIVDRSRLKLVAIPKPGEDPERQKRDKKRKTARKKKVTKSKLALSKERHNSDYWKNAAHRLWGQYAHITKKVCAVCGKHENAGKLDAHHLIGKRNGITRNDPENCLMLCVNHHKLDVKLSAHEGQLGFIEWLKENMPDKVEYIRENRYKTGKYSYKEDYEHLNQLIKEHEGEA